jgi:hypothetical protein
LKERKKNTKRLLQIEKSSGGGGGVGVGVGVGVGGMAAAAWRSIFSSSADFSFLQKTFFCLQSFSFL